MKKNTALLLIAAGMFLTKTNAQQFFAQDNYVGALSSDVSKDWTTGWTEWDPQQKSYPAVTETSTLDASSAGKLEISSTLTLDASKVYLLKGIIVIKSGGKLVIPAGTVIRAEADLNTTPKNYASIVVERGGQIEINGTSSNPVIFTSNKNAGSRNRGDWGGIVLCGKATNNQGSDVQIEGFNNVSFDGTLAKHGGGSDNNDNSGIIKYCRIEFGGLAFEANKEINGLTFGSVGKSTTIDNIQISFGGDDSYEWFGGNVQCKHLISFKTTDDDFDTDYGYQGAVQYGIGVRDTAYYDLSYNAASGASTSEGFESDNDAGGSGKMPYTNAVFSNMTMVGPVYVGNTWANLTSVQKAAFRRGVRIRRNSRISIVNSIFMGYRNFVYFDGDSTMVASGAADSSFPSNMAFRNNLIVNSGAAFTPASSTANGLVEVSNAIYLNKFDGWLKASTNANNINPVAYTSKTVLEDPNHPTAPNFRPVSTSPALSGAGWTTKRLLDYGVYNHVKGFDNLVSYSIYPNPANSVIYADLFLLNNSNVNISILDLNGKTIQESRKHELHAGENRIELDVKNLNNGLYLIHVQSASGNMSSRVMIQN
ncbi:MAG: T9SS type A sorting domain-containing protein [Bacteroidetes bacterium]|nr:T9SS type A sorting domain-containing protein [Bacteroidota bacterium]